MISGADRRAAISENFIFVHMYKRNYACKLLELEPPRGSRIQVCHVYCMISGTPMEKQLISESFAIVYINLIGATSCWSRVATRGPLIQVRCCTVYDDK